MHWVIFDGWGVVFTASDDVGELLVPFLQRRDPSITLERVKALYASAVVGRMSAEQFWAELGFAEQYPEIQTEYLDSGPQLDGAFVPLAHRLHDRYSLGFLSNDLKVWSEHLRKRFDVDRFFKAVVVSGEVGFRKPQPGIYEALLGRTYARGDQCVLIDDRRRNLRGAAEHGIRTIYFDRGFTEGDEAFEPDATVKSHAELPRAIEQVFGG